MATRNAARAPDLFICDLEVGAFARNKWLHYCDAKREALNSGYESPFLVYEMEVSMEEVYLTVGAKSGGVGRTMHLFATCSIFTPGTDYIKVPRDEAETKYGVHQICKRCLTRQVKEAM